MRVLKRGVTPLAAALFCFALLQLQPLVAQSAAGSTDGGNGGTAAQTPAPPGSAGEGSQAARQLLFWRAERAGSTVYLLAAIHLAGPEIYPLDRAITDAFDRCKSLVVEVDVQTLSPAVLRKLMQRYAYYPEGDSLDKHLPAGLLEQVEQAAATAGLPSGAVERMRPWLLESVLSTVDTGSSRLDPAYGVDNWFLTLAHQRKMPIVSLETAAQQLSIISALPEPLQIRSLSETVQSVREARGDLAALYEAWKSGDLEQFKKVVLTPFQADKEMEQVYDALFADRNRRWAQRIDQIAAPDGGQSASPDGGSAAQADRNANSSAPGPIFLVVGAGHLVGPRNLRELLEARGWRVQRMTPLLQQQKGL
ncbi:TraB/GumN family protein [Salinispira pacifica]